MKPQILFEDYAKVEIRVGEIVEAMVPEGSEKWSGVLLAKFGV